MNHLFGLYCITLLCLQSDNIQTFKQQKTNIMKFTISYYFTRCFETAYKIEQGDKILIFEGRIYCAVSPTYREQARLKREREIRQELSGCNVDTSLLALSELITLRTQLLNK